MKWNRPAQIATEKIAKSLVLEEEFTKITSLGNRNSIKPLKPIKLVRVINNCF